MLTLMFLTLAGCDPFETQPSTVTTNPSAEQVQHCRDLMYINPNVEISPLGHCRDYGFQDDAVHFKFTAMTDNPNEIFQRKFVPSEKLLPRDALRPPRYGLADAWWDASKQSLIGGDFIVPDPKTNGDRGLHIGILKNNDGTCTVYSSWFET